MPPLSPRRTHIALVAACLALSACGDSLSPAALPTMSIVAGGSASDTVFALLPQALIVELRDGRGMPMPGVEIRFSAPIDSARNYPTMFFRRLGSFSDWPSAVDTTDAAGRAAVQVRLGPFAGNRLAIVAAPIAAVSDTARYTVRPGAPTVIALAASDTTLTVGTSYATAPRVSDRGQNPLTGQPTTLTIVDGVATTDGAATITAAAPTRVTFVVRSGAAVDTAHVSFVPPGSFVAVAGTSNRLVTMQLDGSAARTLATLQTVTARPTWTADGSRVVYQDPGQVGASVTHVFEVAMDGATTPVYPVSPQLVAQAFPTVTADGWIYFMNSSSAAGLTGIWRMRGGDSTAEQLTEFTPWAPAVSPDGSRIAYTAWNAPTYATGVGVLTLATGATGFIAGGDAASWSPDGALIAFVSVNGTLSVIAPDGSGARVVSTTHHYGTASRPSWSSDGRLLLMRGPDRLELVDVTTGAVIPLSYSSALSQAALHP